MAKSAPRVEPVVLTAPDRIEYMGATYVREDLAASRSAREPDPHWSAKDLPCEREPVCGKTFRTKAKAASHWHPGDPR